MKFNTVDRIHIFAKDIEKTETTPYKLPMHNEFNILSTRINAFIRKYYQNRLIKGLILSMSLLLALYLFIDFIEYFAWLGKTGRRILFFGFMFFSLFSMIYWVIVPLLKIFNLGKTISQEEAAVFLGKHFPEVNDKLLNLLQLEEKERDVAAAEVELLSASIEQKTKELKPVPFTRAVNFKTNLKYLKYFVPTAIVLAFLFVVYPSFVTSPSNRIFHYNQRFEKPLPYKVTLLNTELSVVQHDNFTLKVKIDGEEIPQDVFVKSPGFTYKLYPVKPGFFEYTFNNVNNDFLFQIETGDYISKEYQLKVLAKPVVYSFDVLLKYPAYLHKKQDKISGLGDLVVPEGTIIYWRIHTKDATEVHFVLGDTTLNATPVNENTFEQQYRVSKSFQYGFVALNNFVNSHDTIYYAVQVVKDEYPKITVKEYKSMQVMGYLQFNGQISDDYGFYSLKVYYKQDKNEAGSWASADLPFNKSVPEQYFEYNFNLVDLGLKPGEGLNYFFEVRDNDALHGYKKTTSLKGYAKLPSNEELEKAADSTADKVKASLQKRLHELEKLNKQVEEFKLDLLDKKELNWAEKQKLAQMLNREKEVQQRLDELKKLNEEIQSLEQAINKVATPELKQRLEELQKMFEELNDKKFQNELEKMKKDLEKMDKDKLNRFLDEMKHKNESLKENLEQNLELFKQMELEKKFTETAQKLSRLAEKQKQLAEESKNKTKSSDSLSKEQQKLNNEFKKLEKEIDESVKLDKELEQPFNIKKDTASINKIKSDLGASSKQLEKNRRKKASESQEGAAAKMKKMSESMMSMMSAAMQQRTGEDMDMIRRLLDNLMDLSFQLEKLNTSISETDAADPRFVTSAQELSKMKESFTILRDSLRAIGKRQVFIQPFIIRESKSIKTNMTNAIALMQDRKKGQSLAQQQYALTHVNNLALMLEEALEKMQQSMSMSSSNKSGKNACPNPGKGAGKPSLKDIMQMQESLSNGLKKGSKGKGKKSSSGKKEKGSGQGENGNSAELARMAAMQYEIRQKLQEYMEELKSNGGNGNALNDILKNMDKTEEDIINRNITRQTIERQNQIKVRLLKAENAELQREKEKRRESQEGKNNLNRNLTKNLKYKKSHTGQEGIILLKPVELNYFLKSVYKKYLFKIEMDSEKRQLQNEN
ncbi:MAG: hypothetical protein DRJ09_02985 [Bacteroidetes bacterium]|nr:MAG: hypothetical protein DRJ09_02985 [Bacteroidota bacterium]